VKPNFQNFTEEALIQQFSAREREQPKSAFDAKCGADVLVVHLMLPSLGMIWLAESTAGWFFVREKYCWLAG
jgi:hypothetical protein